MLGSVKNSLRALFVAGTLVCGTLEGQALAATYDATASCTYGRTCEKFGPNNQLPCQEWRCRTEQEKKDSDRREAEVKKHCSEEHENNQKEEDEYKACLEKKKTDKNKKCEKPAPKAVSECER